MAKQSDDILVEGAEVTMKVVDIDSPEPKKRGPGRPPGAKNKPKPRTQAPQEPEQNSEEGAKPAPAPVRREPVKHREVSPLEHRWWWLLRMR
jgi:hypothetical protein